MTTDTRRPSPAAEPDLLAQLLRANSGSVAPAHEDLTVQLQMVLDQRDTARRDAERYRESLERLALNLAAAHARQADDRHRADHLRHSLRDLAARHGLSTAGTTAAVLARLDAALAAHAAAHLALVPPGALLGDVYDDHDLHVVRGDPRRVPIIDALEGRSSVQLIDWVQGDAPTLATVEPLGPVTPYDGPAEHGRPAHAEHGWRITGWCPLAQVLGPQGREILEIARTWARLRDDDPSAVLDAYTTSVESLLPVTGDDADSPLLTAASCAEAALRGAGVDTEFLTPALPAGGGWEVLAVAARDLIGTTPTWTPETYAVLTQPWRTAVGAAHPHDELLAS